MLRAEGKPVENPQVSLHRGELMHDMSQTLGKRSADGDTRPISLRYFAILWEQRSKLYVRDGSQLFLRINNHFMERTIVAQNQIGCAVFGMRMIRLSSDISQHRLHSGICVQLGPNARWHFAQIAPS